MPVTPARSSGYQATRSNLAYDANRRRMIYGPLQPMDRDGTYGLALISGLWSRLRRG